MNETVKRGFAAVRTDIADLKAEVTDTKSVVRRVVATLIRLEGKIDDMGAQMATKEDMAKRMDGFSATLEDSRFHWAVHAKTLTEHDKRLSKLESRRA